MYGSTVCYFQLLFRTMCWYEDAIFAIALFSVCWLGVMLPALWVNGPFHTAIPYLLVCRMAYEE